NEDLYCQAMRACSALNDRAGIAQKYQQLKLNLANELNMEPLPDTSELYRNLAEKTGKQISRN
ncbi:MAG: bacterial transcriptional activator domain-containing protein, partial [Anaerolineales bacterium]